MLLNDFQQITVEESKKVGKFIGEKLNIDTLQALLEYHFSNYPNDNISLTNHILNYLVRENISMKKISKFAEDIQPYVDEINMLLNKNNTINYKTSRANLMLYALEIFDTSYTRNENFSRDKIINKIKKYINK
ncbi:MAG: hypothetical protein U5K55_16875 [Aliarcobacter sp.]|nr:hypothetical protein [Aliarcobacter sp.]